MAGSGAPQALHERWTAFAAPGGCSPLTVVLPVRLGLGISGRGAAGAGARGWGEAAGGGGREAGLLQ